jgi:CRISPR/Cas system CSM-associated protein Csm2 small subunit/phage shock protein A
MFNRIYKNNKLNLLIIFVLIFFAFSIVAIDKYDSNDPTTWPSNQIKEWLAEHEITYKGIPEKNDLIELVKSNFNSSYNNNEPKPQSNTEVIKSYVNTFIDYIGGNINDAKELTADKLDEYSQTISTKIEDLRRSTGLTEDQMSEVFDEIDSQLKSTKTSVNKNVSNTLHKIKESYSLATARRDVLIQKSSNRIQQDIHNFNDVSNDTIEWFIDEFNKTTSSLAKARVLPQLTLVVHGIQEELFKRKISTQEDLEGVSEKLTSAVKSTMTLSYEDYKKSLNNILYRVKHELTKTIGGTADYIVEELRSQLETANDYRLLTQEKIQGALDSISKKYYDSKNLTSEQYKHIKNIFSEYFNSLLGFFSSATDKIRGRSRETIETADEKAERSISYVKNYLDDVVKNQKTYGNQKIDQLLEAMIKQVSSTQQLTNEQLDTLTKTLKDKQGPFKNTKSVKDITEDTINAYVTLLRDRFKEFGEKISDTKDQVGEKIVDTKDQIGQKIFDTKEQIEKKVEDYRKEEL